MMAQVVQPTQAPVVRAMRAQAARVTPGREGLKVIALAVRATLALAAQHTMARVAQPTLAPVVRAMRVQAAPVTQVPAEPANAVLQSADDLWG